MEDLKCPNCGGSTIDGGGGKRVCGTCGGSFTFVAGEAKLTGVGELEKIKGSVEKHDRDIEDLKKALPGVGKVTPPAADPETDTEEEESEDAEEDL